ncbi:GNAT family N-acetyltransferase [Streptomyces bohaiensis]|nr:GNAT family N-acetyltransferase [Streptomyces bohaiensis]
MVEVEALRAEMQLERDPWPTTRAGAEVEVRAAASEEEIMAASALFDGPVRAAWAERFAAESTHHLLFAYADNTPVGMVSGMEITHPDKGTEMLLYELGVDEEHRRRGVGTVLVRELLRIARDRGCGGMWTAAETDDEAALRTYRSAGGDRESDAATVVWSISAPGSR